MKKIFTIFILTIFLFLNSFKSTFAEEKYFVVTAYYSPLEGQEYYMRGNLEKEKILQGEGTHGASGKKIFSGMLAAPKNYNFGTKIYLEGLGVGVVEDRGQAIVNKGERGYNYDRLDVWMGYGDEGLKRALAWGKRTIKGEIVDPNTQITINYKNHPAPDSAVSHLIKKEKTVFDINIGKNSKPEDILKLQNFLTEIGVYKGSLDGVYNEEMISLIYDFQVKSGILSNKDDIGAGYWGEKTKFLFKQKYSINKIKDESINKEINIFSSFNNSEKSINELEKIFKEIGFLDDKTFLDKNNFSDIILKFQLSEKIIYSENELGAGIFGPKTRSKLKEKYEFFKDKQIEFERKKAILKDKYKKIYLDSEKILDEKFIFSKNKIIKKGDISSDVRIIQEILIELGYLGEKSTAIYGDKTYDAIIKIQSENNLFDGNNNSGLIGENTFYLLKENLRKKYINDKINEYNFSKDDMIIIEELKKDKI